MARTADRAGSNGSSPKDVGRQIRHIRRKQGLSRAEVARSAGLTRRELAAYERGRSEVPESDLWCLAGSCGVDVGELLPNRAPVKVSQDLSMLAVGDSIRYLRSPVDDDDLLREYLSMIYELRNLAPGTTPNLRERDLMALADALGGSPEKIEARLVELIGMSRHEAARLRSMILPPRSLEQGESDELTQGDPYSELREPDAADDDGEGRVFDFFSGPRSADPFEEPPPPLPAQPATAGWDALDMPVAPLAPAGSTLEPEPIDVELTSPLTLDDAPPPLAADPFAAPAAPGAPRTLDDTSFAPLDEPITEFTIDEIAPAWEDAALPSPFDGQNTRSEAAVSAPFEASVAEPITSEPVDVDPTEPGSPFADLDAGAVFTPPAPDLGPADDTMDDDTLPRRLPQVDEPEPMFEPVSYHAPSEAAVAAAPAAAAGAVAPIAWVATDEPEVDRSNVAAPRFERAGSNWRVGGIFPATATADDGALALRRADARWALADLEAPGDFVVEANVDFTAGAGFGILFRASVDGYERVTGYSFDIDPIAGGGGYLVRQWEDNKQHWRPLAQAPVTDPTRLLGRHTLSVTLRADHLTVIVDDEPILSVPALSRCSVELGRPPCRGSNVGVQAWATTEVTVDSFRVARY